MIRNRRTVLLSAVVALVLAVGGAAGFALLRGSASVDPISSLPQKEVKAAATLDSLLNGPVTFDHNMYAGDYGAQSFGNGYLDLRDDCQMEATYTSALYAVDIKVVDSSVWQRSTKRETNLTGPWEKALPLNSNVNSPLLSLAGNPYTMLCALRDITRPLQASGNEYVVDPAALDVMVQAVRLNEMTLLLSRIGTPKDEISSRLANLEFGASILSEKLERVVLEQTTADSLRIIVVGNGNRMLDELVIRRAAEKPVTGPVEVNMSTDEATTVRKMFGLTAN